MQVIIHIDGGSRGNPGPAAAGVLIRDAASDRLVHEAGYRLGKLTNNAAEYQALIKGVAMALELGATSAVIHSDSQLLVRQIRGQYKVKSADLRPLYDQAQKLLDRLSDWRIEHVKREENHRADILVNQVLDTDRDVVYEHGGERGVGATDDSAAGPPMMRCAVRLARLPDARCPCHGAMSAGPYTFGPATPEGLCVHAARAVLNSGVFDRTPTRGAVQVHCPHCGVPIQIVPSGG